jgi:hypothetical protein
MNQLYRQAVSEVDTELVKVAAFLMVVFLCRYLSCLGINWNRRVNVIR